MTTLAQLKKLAKDAFTPFLAEKGFEQVSAFTYTRDVKEGVKHVIYPNINYGENLTVYISCHVPEMDDYLGSTFPKNLLDGFVGGELDPSPEPLEFPGVFRYGSHLWKVPDESSAHAALVEIKACVIEFALPFFAGIQNRQDMINAMHPHQKEEYEDLVESILENR